MSIARQEPLLTTGAQQLGVELDATQRHQLLRLSAELADWNTRINLTAIRDPADMVRKHLLDSLSVLPHLHGQSIADVGSGAGFPGLPLAIARPELKFTLIESTTKKARFIEHAASELQLGNVEVVNARAEAWRPPQRFDTVIARALGKIADFVRLAGHLCARTGRLLAMKGRYPQEELEAVPAGWKVESIERLRVPGLDAERHLVILARSHN